MFILKHIQNKKNIYIFFFVISEYLILKHIHFIRKSEEEVIWFRNECVFFYSFYKTEKRERKKGKKKRERVEIWGDVMMIVLCKQKGGGRRERGEEGNVQVRSF